MSKIASVILRTARARSGLSQRQLAQRAKTAQSVVARIELEAASPTWETLTRLVAAAGFDLDARLTVRPVSGSHMLADVARILRLTPEQRLQEVANAGRFAAAARRVSPRRGAAGSRTPLPLARAPPRRLRLDRSPGGATPGIRPDDRGCRHHAGSRSCKSRAARSGAARPRCPSVHGGR